MQLNDITTEIRLRSAWEAVDLGLTMIQHNWRLIYASWTLVIVSFALLIGLLAPAPIYALLVLWWLKPVFDRVLLLILSRQLFNQSITTAQIITALPALLRHTGLWGALTWRRLSLSRGFNLPIWQLEQLRGKARKQRQQLLHQQTHGYAVWLTIACIHLEYVIIASLYALVLWLTPQGYWSDYLSGIFTHTFDEDTMYWSALIYFVVYSIAVWLIEPLYISASFSLYLNRRTQLEAWDIELAFRKLGERLRQAAPSVVGLLLAVVCGFATLIPTSVYATPNADSESVAPTRLQGDAARAQIDAIMQQEAFSHKRKVKRWTAREIDKANLKMIGQSKSLEAIVASIMKAALWISVVILGVLGIAYRHQLLALLKPLTPQTPSNAPPDILFGMDIRPESLPEDIAAASQHLWEKQQYRAALGLLYRGALMHLTRHEGVALQQSHTEGDILTLAQSALDTQRFNWLHAVTHAWQEVAYAHRIPAANEVMPLFSSWATFSREPPTQEHA